MPEIAIASLHILKSKSKKPPFRPFQAPRQVSTTMSQVQEGGRTGNYSYANSEATSNSAKVLTSTSGSSEFHCSKAHANLRTLLQPAVHHVKTNTNDQRGLPEVLTPPPDTEADIDYQTPIRASYQRHTQEPPASPVQSDAEVDIEGAIQKLKDWQTWKRECDLAKGSGFEHRGIDFPGEKSRRGYGSDFKSEGLKDTDIRTNSGYDHDADHMRRGRKWRGRGMRGSESTLWGMSILGREEM